MYERMITFHKIVNFIYEMAWPILSFSLGIPWEGGGGAEEILGIFSQDNQSPPT